MEAVIRAAIKEVLTDFGLEVDFSVEHPADLSHGDYASNVALVAAKAMGVAPRTLAERVCAALHGKIANVSAITIAGPGFINFHLERQFFVDQVKVAIKQGSEWGRGSSWQGKRVVVEYTDPNPFKEFHIGHLFTNVVGESIARLFMMGGAEVKRVCYQADVGLHVAHAIWGMQQLGLTEESDFSAKELGRAYALGATAYKENEADKAAITALNKIIYERSDEAINALYDQGRAVSLSYFEEIYALVGTKFDAYFFESEVAGAGKQLVLDHPDVFTQSAGAYIFVGEQFGLHTRVFLNQQGLPTYEAKELALAKLKADRLHGYDHSVVSTAKEINEYFKVLLQAMSFIYPDLAKKTEHIGHGMVRLTSGKMSSRTGNVIAAVDFIAEVATAAKAKIAASGFTEATNELANQVALASIKYATLRSAIEQDSVYDSEKSLSFEGDSGPYLQYTHARISSVLEKAAQSGVTADFKAVPETVYAIERELYRFPEVVAAALAERAPHQVTTYLTELAGAFNSFYASEKIADSNDEFAPYKAALATAVQQTLKNGLWVLGIEAPEQM